MAFNTLGWESVAFSEIEPFPSALLAHHYPDVPNFGDMTNFREWPEEVFVFQTATEYYTNLIWKTKNEIYKYM